MNYSVKALCITCAGVLLCGMIIAEDLPASKAGARATRTIVLNCQEPTPTRVPGCGPLWKTITSLDIKAPGNNKELVVGVSAQTKLTSLTAVASKGGAKKTSAAGAGIQIRVVMDPGAGQRVAIPGDVVYDARYQQLSAALEGQIAGCLSIAEDGSIVLDEECVEPELIELLIATMGSHHFNFILDDVSQGIHTIEVQARARVLERECDQEGCDADASALIRKLSLVVEQVQFVKDDVVVF